MLTVHNVLQQRRSMSSPFELLLQDYSCLQSIFVKIKRSKFPEILSKKIRNSAQRNFRDMSYCGSTVKLGVYTSAWRQERRCARWTYRLQCTCSWYRRKGRLSLIASSLGMKHGFSMQPPKPRGSIDRTGRRGSNKSEGDLFTGVANGDGLLAGDRYCQCGKDRRGRRLKPSPTAGTA